MNTKLRCNDGNSNQLKFADSSNLDKIKEGISEKLAIFSYLMTSFVVCVLFSLYYGWKLTLVIMSCTPFTMIATALAAKVSEQVRRIFTRANMNEYFLK